MSRKLNRIFLLMFIFAASCIVPKANLQLEGNIFGYQDGDYCVIIFNVKNYGNKPALGSKVTIYVTNIATEEVLDFYDEFLGDFLPDESRKFESDLPRQFQWGDDIGIKMEFRWE